MENRYLYRGKRIDNGEWIVGSLIVDKHQDIETGEQIEITGIYPSEYKGFSKRVDPSTICQCTGYDGIYEKDIFQCDDERYVIEWCDYSLGWEAQAIGSSESISLGEFSPKEIDVIGNKIDNPELLEVHNDGE